VQIKRSVSLHDGFFNTGGVRGPENSDETASTLSGRIHSPFTTSRLLNSQNSARESSMTHVLMILLIGAALLVLGWLAVSSLTGLASPAGARPGLRAVLARVICPETGTPTRVRLGVITETESALPDVLECERFPAGVVTCERRCLLQEGATSPPVSLALAPQN
jgi:hypothetical protein